MRIFDVSNPAAPIQVASYADLPDAGDIFVEGDYAYIAAGSQGLLVWDISDPTTATQVAAYATVAPAHDLHVVDNHVYVTFHERGEDLVGLEIVDVTDPRAPEQAGLYLLSDWVERTRWGEAYIDVYVASGYAYLAWYHICLPACDGGLRIVDVSDPAAPADVAFYNLGRAVARSVFRVGASVYLSGGGTGLYVFRFAPPTSATIGPDGGSLTSPIDDTTYTFPAGAFSDSVTVTHTILQPSEVPPTGPWMTVGHIFRVEAMYDDTGEAAEPAQPYTVTVVYKDAERGPAIETSLALYYWDSDSVQWVAEPTSEVNSESNTVTATPDHLRLWALLGGTHRFYLPLLFHVE
jgi:hypothetical protein